MIYAAHASCTFNLRLHDLLQRLTQDVAHALGDNLLALILGGGYGRGEGGVVIEASEEKPYNDLDLVLILNQTGDASSRLEPIRAAYERESSLEIDFSRPLTIPQVRSWKNTLMWNDLYHGHVVLHGPQDILLQNAPARIHEPVPPVEATRLLLNRGAGLLWALLVSSGVEKAPDADFIRRNYFKAALALGDAVLISQGQFQTAYTGRDRLLSKVSFHSPEVAELDLQSPYEQALRFKFSPSRISEKTPTDSEIRDLAGLWGQVLTLIERERVGQDFRSIEDYVNWKGLRERSESRIAMWPRNLFRNAQHGYLSCRYPRERLYQQLPGLLGLAEARSNWVTASQEFLRIWRSFN